MRNFSLNQIACASVVLLAACSAGAGDAPNEGNGPTGGNSTAYVGAFASATESGTLSLALAASATGTMTQVNGTSTSLTGTYTASTGAVSLSGSGFTFSGTLVSGTLTGSFTSSKGSGSFSAQTQGTASTPPKTFCGTYVNPADFGWLNLVVAANGAVSGQAVSGAGAGSVTITGTLTATTLTATTNQAATVTGVLSADGTTITGTYLGGGTTGTTTWTFTAGTGLCGGGSSVSTSAAGNWGVPSGSGLSTTINVVLSQSGSSLSGAGAIHVTNISGYTGDRFNIQSGSFTNQTITFTAQLGANPVGNGTFYYGTLTFTGTESSSSSATGILTYTPPRTATQIFQAQAVAGVTITR